jgi:hypothetical protein
VQACIEAIKAVFYTLAAVSEGSAASHPIPSEDVDMIRPCASQLALLLIARMQRLTREAQVLLANGSDNPLRGLRYMMNCIWKLYDIADFAVLVRSHGDFVRRTFQSCTHARCCCPPLFIPRHVTRYIYLRTKVGRALSALKVL